VNRWRASKRPDDHALEPEARHDPQSKAASQKQNPVLTLHRAVGNQALQKMLPHSEGEPIADSERLTLETAFGQDLSQVRIHRDEDGAELNAHAGANALATGREIYFPRGAYSSPKQAVVDPSAGDRNLDANTQNAVKALVDAFMQLKVR
jgi:hypothetical protein